ncbi:MAG: protein kinase [Myxococcales bacterium]|nr:protein kinase [Myxococcales bacterium]MCB9717739.1 protein kinase [Myxococcales bacterium]
MREPLAVGKTVGRYELIHRLGHGGMAAVFLGRATRLRGFEKLAAVKVIHPHLAAEPEFVEMFLDEARIAARLHHPHVVEIHDLGDDDGVYYMVMEYVEGETLASMLRQLRKSGEHLPLSAVLQVVADACEGLAAAHELTHPDGRPMHLVHRDVSPHNLLVSMDGRVKVVDFGIAKATGRRSSTRTGQLRGKLAYMSPEQAGGGTIDHRTDLFALGAVLWELLTNERLFMAETESETIARVTACEVPDIESRRDDLPGGVVELVSRALARDPEQRFESAQEMLRETRAQLRALEGEAEPRDDLAAVMERLFSARIGYIRAAVRRASESGTRASPAANDPVNPFDATKASSRPNAGAGSGSGPVARPSTSSLPAVAVATGTQTLTTSLAGAPARHWSLWLLLPLVGAVVGAAMVSRGFGQSDAPEVPRSEEPRPSLASSAGSDAPRPVPTAVKWQFDIDPPGATITLDGQALADTSPTTIDVPRGDDAIEVVISKPGYRQRTLHPVPTASNYFHERLELLPAETEADPPPELSKKPRHGTWLKARTKADEGKAQPTTAEDPKVPSEPATNGERRPPPPPDFDSYFDEERKGKDGAKGGAKSGDGASGGS